MVLWFVAVLCAVLCGVPLGAGATGIGVTDTIAVGVPYPLPAAGYRVVFRPAGSRASPMSTSTTL